MKVTWGQPEVPLEAAAVCGSGAVADKLVERCQDLSRTSDIYRFDAWAVVVGEDLPWADGVVYLGELPGASRVLVPVHQHPQIPPDLLQSALRTKTGSGGQVAVVPTGSSVTVLPLGEESES